MSIEKSKIAIPREGLSEREVTESRQKHGDNTLTPPRKTSMWQLYLEKYKDPIIQILLVAATISLVLAIVKGEYMETIGIFIAIFLATTIGFYFERDAARKFRILTSFNEDQPVKVRRDGHVMNIPRGQVVVGDVVLVETGDEVPADGRLVISSNLQIDESSLTGEQLTSKHANADDSDSGDEAFPKNMLLRSTMVMNGMAEFVVTAVGDNTEIGHVARSSNEKTGVKTPLHNQLDRLAKLISKIGITVAVVAFVLFLLHDIITNTSLWHSDDYIGMIEEVLKYFMMAVTLIVMAVPEGLPMAVTLSLALNMRRMLKSNNLVRKLHACETMGAVNVICTDKTGTLTQNRMNVEEMLTLGDSVKDRMTLPMAIALNTTAHIGVGNPTERALLEWVQNEGCDYEQIRRNATIIDSLPFSTERKMMSTTVETGGQRYLLVKGAPEIIMAMCHLSEEERKRAEAFLKEKQQKAMRTLAMAMKEEEEQSMQLQAIAALADPVREDVPEAVEQCHKAGIEVKIVTGDVSGTAIEIARQIGIEPSEGFHITGAEFAALSDEEALERIKSLKVISRARPQDKQRLVQLLQRQGNVVAVTGDGTNDAPALNYAHVGLSLGSGTSVAKHASDMTLLDDSFRSITSAVMWGRSLYKNIQRFLFFQLVVNVTALLLVLAGSLIGTELPLTVTQILWVNLIMDTFAAMALASLPPSREVMKEKPRSQDDFIITRPMMWGIIFEGIVFFLVLFAMLIHCLYDDVEIGVQRHELTLFFTTFVMIQVWNLFNAKTLGSNHSAFRYLYRNQGLLIVLAMILIGQWLIVEYGGEMFRTDGMNWHEWLKIIASTSVVMWIGELWRLAKRKLRDKRYLQN
ncbi:MAG: calcium-translocating P-type ATPase, PMCA-type [Prevotella sp.]|nr:calcium-translocating P-type ATPase, PMCA-type [Prevotella sp.]